MCGNQLPRKVFQRPDIDGPLGRKRVIPLFDSHCHLHDARLDGVRDEVVRRAVEAGVEGCVSCGTHPGEWDAVAALSATEGFEVRRAFGVHPWFADGLPTGWEDDLRSRLARFHDAAVGEIGLDAIRPPAADALPVLRRQFEIAAELGRPVVLHGAKALDELLAEFRRFAGKIPSCVVHAFSGSREQLRNWLDAGAMISVGGTVCRSERLRELATEIPPDRLLIETDSPDMLPPGGIPAIPGTRLNQPSNLPLVARAIETVVELNVNKGINHGTYS